MENPIQNKKKVAYVPQRGSVDWDFPTDALDVVEMGLYGKLGWFHVVQILKQKRKQENVLQK